MKVMCIAAIVIAVSGLILSLVLLGAILNVEKNHKYDIWEKLP